MKILPASADDAEAIVAIWNPVIRDSTVTFTSIEKTRADITKMIAERPAFLVAHQGADLLGFATYGPFRAGIGYAHTKEHTVILAESARGNGVGRALMSTLEAHARAGGVHSLIAGVSDENPAAIAFHKALGFDQVGHIPEVGRKFGRWLGTVFLQKIL